MSHTPPDDDIARLLRMLRLRQYEQALQEAQALESGFDNNRQVVLEGCKLLLQWYNRPIGTHYDQGLAGAITGVSILRDEGYRPLIAWDMASVGYAMGILGDLETGIAWLDVALEDIRQTGDDPRGEIYFLAHKGSLLSYADQLDAAGLAFGQALKLCEGAQTPLKAGVLGSLAYWHLLQARSSGDNLSETHRLARQALDTAKEALTLMQGRPEFAPFEASSLDTMAQAQVLLNDYAQAEALISEGLSKSALNRDAHFGLLIGQAELMMRQGRLQEAAQILDAAHAKPSTHQVGMMMDRFFLARIELARLAERPDEVQSRWKEYLQWFKNRDRERLRRVHEHAEVHARLMRLQSQARTTQLELKTTELALLQSKLEAENTRQQERESFMLNLHDGLGSQLATARLRAQWGKLSQDDLILLLDECMADLHLVVDTLGSNEGDLGRALSLLRDRTQRRLVGSGIEVQWILAADEAPALPPVLLTNVLRVLQEALTNALKHARARNIQVVCDYHPQEQTLLIQVIDDGQSIAASAQAHTSTDPGASAAAGKGLQNLHLRARRVGGDLRVRSRLPGTEVEFSLQLNSTGS